ncbi:hypothetical protein EYR40_001528 [Pleurotus pulmonarius]|nr:hypothetical protein EYR38_004771 [Pleurotus pulmonarius]KAF4609175.1 hypothetical protein EYR40_001528 [Pleurotus pulmonarius]
MYSYEHQQYNPSSTFINPAMLALPGGNQSNATQQTFYPRSPTALEIRDKNVPRQTSFRRVPMYEPDQFPPSEEIRFTLRGCVGPSVQDILDGNARLDNARSTPFEHTGHRSTMWRLYWAGALLSGSTLPLINKGGVPITLGQVAYDIACEVRDVHRKLRNPKKSLRSPQDDPRFPMSRLELNEIYLIAFSRYKTHWVPVLAVESH